MNDKLWNDISNGIMIFLVPCPWYGAPDHGFFKFSILVLIDEFDRRELQMLWPCGVKEHATRNGYFHGSISFLTRAFGCHPMPSLAVHLMAAMAMYFSAS
jgi:hypothetical protein